MTGGVHIRGVQRGKHGGERGRVRLHLPLLGAALGIPKATIGGVSPAPCPESHPEFFSKQPAFGFREIGDLLFLPVPKILEAVLDALLAFGINAEQFHEQADFSFATHDPYAIARAAFAAFRIITSFPPSELVVLQRWARALGAHAKRRLTSARMMSLTVSSGQPAARRRRTNLQSRRLDVEPGGRVACQRRQMSDIIRSRSLCFV